MENNEKKEFIKEIDYYLESGYVIFTEKYLLERMEGCCGNSCRHCPYEDGKTKLKKEYEKK